MQDGPTPLDWRSLPGWIARTRQVDDRSYARRRRPWTLRRWWGVLRPDLSRPVFVVGAPRSGTSFLGEACAALPELSYHYEPPLIKAAARVAAEGAWSERRLRRLHRSTYAWLLRRHGDGDLGLAEKTPHNCFQVDRLARWFPDARFVHILRDGRDAALSHRATGWLSAASARSRKRESGGYPLGPAARFWVERERRAEFEATSDLHRCIWAWRRHVESALEKLAALPPGRRLEIRYERLTAHPALETERLLDFLEIESPDSRARARAHLAGADPARVGVWRRALATEEREMVEAETGGLLAKLGYAWEEPS
jgi:hypothetical protein